MVVKLAGSIDALLSASRHSSELPANASSANDVRENVLIVRPGGSGRHEGLPYDSTLAQPSRRAGLQACWTTTLVLAGGAAQAFQFTRARGKQRFDLGNDAGVEPHVAAADSLLNLIGT